VCSHIGVVVPLPENQTRGLSAPTALGTTRSRIELPSPEYWTTGPTAPSRRG
jgi:hypothetical protein